MSNARRIEFALVAVGITVLAAAATRMPLTLVNQHKLLAGYVVTMLVFAFALTRPRA